MIDIQSKNGNSKFFLLTLLGMLTAFGPFVTDMYLPSLPSMGEYFKTTPSLVQLGLTASMIGLAAGQIFFGPLSDKYGRRSPLLAAMYLFIISTIGCIFAPTIEIFVILRLLQGIAGAGGIVIDTAFHGIARQRGGGIGAQVLHQLLHRVLSEFQGHITLPLKVQKPFPYSVSVTFLSVSK